MSSYHHNAEYDIVRINDKALHNALNSICEDIGKNELYYAYSTFIHNDKSAKKSINDFSNDELINNLSEYEAVILKSFELSINESNVIVTIERMRGKPDDKLTVTINDYNNFSNKRTKEIIVIYNVLRKRLTFVDSLSIPNEIEKLDINALQRRNENVDRLERVVYDMIKQMAESVTSQAEVLSNFQQNLMASYDDKIKQITDHYNEKQNQLDEEHKNRSTMLIQKEHEYEKRVNDLKLRESTKERREISERVQALLKGRSESFRLTDAVYEDRKVTRNGYIALIITTLILALILLAINVYNNFSQPWQLVPQVLFSISCITTAAFYLRWENNWNQKHADAEFQSKQYELDFERASFVVEWVLEAEQLKKQIPDHLLQQLSKNIFNNYSTDDANMTAIESLISGIKIKHGDTEASVDLKK